MTTVPLAERREHAASARTKRVQAGLSTAAGTIGIGGLGALIGSKGLKRAKKPHLQQLGHKLGSGAGQAAIVGGGVGALSSLNFANLSRKEAAKEKTLAAGAKPMDNKSLTSKSLSGIVKAYAIHPEAWEMAGDRKRNDWRPYVSEGARHAYDEPLRRSQKRAAMWKYLNKNRAAKWDEAGRKIRAKGYERMLEQQNVQKGWASAGGFSRSSVGRTRGGKIYSRRGYLTPTRRRRY